MGEGDFDSAESWMNARKYAGLLGEVPNSFSSTIRSMLLDQERQGSLGSGSRFLAMRLLKTTSVKAPLYFATLTYQEEKLAGQPYVAPEAFLDYYSPSELSAVLGLMYLYRRAKKLSPSDEWPHIGGALQTCVDLGGHVGYVIPPIGPVVGILSSGLRYLGAATFLIHDKKGFAEYRRFLKQKQVRFDAEQEIARWGCTNVQIAGVFLQALGFGIELANSMARGLRVNPNVAALDKPSYRFYINEVWLDSLLNLGVLPDITHRGEFYPSKLANEKLLEKTEQLRSGGSAHSWLNRGKEDCDPNIAPQLFDPNELAKGAPAVAEEAEESAELDEILEQKSDGV